MKVLFVHQHFPGQFRSLAPALAARGHTAKALQLRRGEPEDFLGVLVHPYLPAKSSTVDIHRWVVDFETQVIRAEACFHAAMALRRSGFTPDVIVGHPGWGETLFLKDVWPSARLGVYCEFYYRHEGQDIGFDPEFPIVDAEAEPCRVRLKNLTSDLSMKAADAALCPTYWQAQTFPVQFRDKISVIHDGIDTDRVAPKLNVGVRMPTGQVLTRDDEIVTFVNRSLEPARGYHMLMRALPEILSGRPAAHVLMIGEDRLGYGGRPPGGGTWKQQLIDEVRPQIPNADWERVHFLGKVPYEGFLAALQVSTVHVYLTYPFVLSWSLIEAMSAGCAIVASDTAPVREAISHDETGRLVDFFDVGGLAREVCRLLDRPAERSRLGAAARAKAIAEYDLKTVCLPRQLAWVDRLASL